ncbi:thiol-disulfide oxidoreductase DCC family protein [Caldimonas sp. KR1-144]|uniref:thiol-disulfide oxidoreductase DCC family protein n=1 Tax=Caldimonas sp. KR1-144 TaxID=3400911 RepID=UPI003C0F0EBC
MDARDDALTLLYDAACPVCSLEMDHLRERDAAGRLRFVDIAAPGFDAAAWGTTREALDAEIHGFRADGSVVRGLEALRLAYAAVGLGRVLRPTGFGPLRPMADLAYRAFARHRRAISRTAAPLIDALRARRARRVAERMSRCRAGACGLGGDAARCNGKGETS